MAPTRELPAPGLLTSMWRFKWLTVAIAGGVMLLSGLAGFLLAQGVVGDASLTRYTKQRAQFITSDDVLTVVSQAVPQYSLADLRQNVVVDTSSASNQLTITASARSAGDAVRLANVVVDSYRQATAEQVQRLTANAIASIDAARASLLKPGSKPSSLSAQTTVAQLSQQRSSLQTDSAVFNDGVDFVQQASIEDAVVPGVPVRYLGAGLVLGLVAAALIAWLKADRRRFVDDEEVVEPLLQAPLLGTVTLARKQEGVVSPPSLRPYRLISAALTEHAHAVVAVVETGEGVERVEVVASLASAIAGDGTRLLVIDADPQGALTTRLWNGTPTWLRSQPDDEDADAAGRAIARHASARGAEPPVPLRPPATVAETSAREAAEPAREIVPVALPAGVGSAQVLTTVPPAVKPLALPTLALPTVDEPDPEADSSPEAEPQGAERRPELNGHGRDPEPSLDGEAPAADDEESPDQPPIQRVPVRGDLGLDLINVGGWKPAVHSQVRREFVDKIAAAAGSYDLVLLDLPAADSSPLVPALLRISTGLVAVVPHGTQERSIERVRRTASMFSTPLLGYVFTRVRK